MPVRITAEEIIRQSEQGVSVRPFLIRADDGCNYFVKGLKRAGGPGLISEVLAAEIGAHLGLAIPPWRIMDIPQALIDFSAIPNVTDLNGGPAFASQQVLNASELTWAGVSKLPIELRRRVLIFDWLIQNGDRCLGEHGGNVNLLLDHEGALTVIDHNAAFERQLSHREFCEFHVFRDLIGSEQDELLARLNYVPQLDEALADWGRIAALLPDEWLYRDQDHVDETEPTLAERRAVLERYREERFWGQL
jgi:hypothetical protein